MKASSHLDHDLRFAIRMLRKNPGLSITAVTAIALGVGISTTMFSVHQAFRAPLPYEQSSELMHLGMRDAQSGRNVMRLFGRDLAAFDESQTSFDVLGAYAQQRVTLSDENALPDVVHAASVSVDVFGIVGAQPMMGRAFDQTDAVPGAAPVALIAERVWQTRYGASPNVLGRSIRLDGETRTIIGVMPPEFGFPLDAHVWTPLARNAVGDPETPLPFGPGIARAMRGADVFGRLRDGVTPETAQREFDQLAARLATAYPETNDGVRVVVQPLESRFGLDPAGHILFTLMLVATVGVLLIACVNVANLLVARTVVRSREVAVRAALGASRARIMSLLLAESTVLAAVGTAIGSAIAMAGVWGINRALAPFGSLPSWMHITVDVEVFLFVVAITALTGLASGLLPALYASRTDINSVLKDEARGVSGRGIGRLSRALVVAELTIACALLVGSAFMIKNGLRVALHDPPYETANVMTASVALREHPTPGTQHPPSDIEHATSNWRERFLVELEERLAASPQVVAATISSNLPGTGMADNRYQTDVGTYDRTEDLPVTRSLSIRPSFFRTFDVAPIMGRAFTEQDLSSNERVVLVNESFARRAFPDGNALGSRIRFGSLEDPGDWSTIVGVLPNMWTPGGFVYQSGEECVFRLLRSTNHMYVALRGRVDAASLVPVIRAEVAAVDRDVAPTDFLSMSVIANRHALFYATFGAAFMISGVASLFLSVIGLYSVMAFVVASRTYELGLRMALGARAANVIALVLRQGIKQITLGLSVGVAIGAGLALALRMIIMQAGGDVAQMRPIDPVLFAVVLSILSATGLAACLIPARRATRVDPMAALK